MGTFGGRARLAVLGVAAATLLSGCVTNEKGELPFRTEFYRTAEKAKSLGLLTPAIAEECKTHVEKMLREDVRIVGPFEISTYAAIRGAQYKMTLLLPDHSADNTVAIIAPVNAKGMFGGEVKSMWGCLYRLQDDRLVFEKAKMFGQRIDVVRRSPDQLRVPQEAK